MSNISFSHTMAAHCETGTMSSLLKFAGLSISEPMVLGIAGGLFFAYLDTSKFTFPTIVTRSKPGSILKNIRKRTGTKFSSARYAQPEKAMADLDRALEAGQPVAVQVDMFYMDYIPAHMRVHFNGHFIVVTGKENGHYTISDCYHPTISTVPSESLQKGRFARGDLAPKGNYYFPLTINPEFNIRKAILAGIKETCRNMVSLPIPFLGVKGIRLFAKKIMTWPDLAQDTEHLSDEIMMINVILEERGTGGAGFRFMFATFLQEAAKVLEEKVFDEFSQRIMEIGDRWREISLFAAKIGKKRDLGPERLLELQKMIVARANDEEQFFKDLKKCVKNMK